MRSNVGTIFKKELQSLFNSPVAYITIIVFLLINSWFFISTFFLINQSDLRQLFNIVPLTFLFFVPAITMSLVAKEKNDGTLEFLTTMPISDSEIVTGKFLAALALLGTALLFTLVHFFTLLIVGNNFDFGALVCGYIGLLILGAAYTSIGIFASTITDNQITAFILGFLIIFVFFIMDKILIFIPGFLTSTIQYLSVDYHLGNITKGVMDTRNLVYFASLISFFLLVSIRILEMRKWR
ncbi:MAG: ABC transporter permease subunit [Candidatus Marinimicrobia bacterium]|nr:ABC transporter permease subunit [Candidatus Neomarinimicrobiota bacterium]